MYFLKLIRPINLAIIALTMFGIHFYTESFVADSAINYLDFGLLIFSTLLIAAGGNIINDYFDVRADRVNKPERLIISKHIKRRWAIFSHWILNITAFFIAIYLCWKHQTFWYVLIHFTSISLLWFYSIKLKKIALLGNIIIAGLSVLVIYLTLIFLQHEYELHSLHYYLLDSQDGVFGISPTAIIFIFMCMAFVQNTLREIVKDIEDVDGDIIIRAKTVPMILGIRETLKIVGVIMLFFPIAFFPGVAFYYPHFDWVHSWPISLAAIVNLIGGIICFLDKSWTVSVVKNLLKISMLVGLTYLFLGI
jgi:4-hydroxybenzoate polyprenyltransferase